MTKLIVTHHHPDLDGIAAAWILVRHLPEFVDPSFAFVPAGQSYRDEPVDSDPDVVHVDTGKGMFDHHDKEREKLSAAELVYRHVLGKRSELAGDEALREMVNFVTDIDHFGEYFWPDPLNSRYSFMLSSIVPSLHLLNLYSPEEVVRMVFVMLDAVYQTLKDTSHAKQEIARGNEFDTVWGKGIAVLSGADTIMKVAQRMGYEVVVRKDPRTGFTKIKSAPKEKIDLRPIYDRIIVLEGDGRWYFHPSGHMLINGTSKNAEVEPSALTPSDIVKIIEKYSAEQSDSA